MLKVSVRKFQLNAKDYIEKLNEGPIMLTRYNLDIAIIHKASQLPEIPQGTVISFEPKGTIEFSPESLGKCKEPFCKSPAIGKYKISVPDNIEGFTVSEGPLCQFHLYQAKKEGTVSKIDL